MSTVSSKTWRRILDYLAEVGASPDLDGFCRQTVKGIADLIPFRSASFLTMKEPGTIFMHDAVGVARQSIAAYNDYYNHLAPFQDLRPEQPIIFNWDKHRDLEFVADYVFAIDAYQSAGIFFGPAPGSLSSHLVISRSRKDSRIDGRDLSILSLLQPHLRNLYSIQAKLADQTSRHLFAAELAGGCRLLSKREAEIARLLCQRLTAPEIATRLLISPYTVQRHIANIYEKMKVGSRRELALKLAGDEGLERQSPRR